MRRCWRTDAEDGGGLAYEYTDLFGKDNFFLEMQDHGLDGDKVVTPGLVRMSQDTVFPWWRRTTRTI